jgi:murein DD-endopeptidase MepM/ murein hydrolase activator NlpD
VRPLRAKVTLAALLPLVLLTAPPSHAKAQAASAAPVATSVPSESTTGGSAYQPLPNQASPVNRGSIPGESGGASYNPALKRTKSGHVRARRRGSAVPPAAPELTSDQHRFPVQGRHSFGGADARFGARRPGHVHQGQDIIAAEGTPVVAPRGGTITWRAYQAQGAGYYLVLDPVGEAFNYVFMHLQRGSVMVGVGDRVRTGQPLARVDSSGISSGPHLHFEIWSGAWYKNGFPIDPLPALLAWDKLP